MDGIRTTLWLVFASAALACTASAGCATDGGATSSPDPYAGPPRGSQYDYDARARGYDDGAAARRYDDGYAPSPAPTRTTAAPDDDNQEDRGPLVPKTARLAAEGRGDLSYKAKRDGYVYIVDRRDKKLIAQMPLDEGEEILIAPYRNVIEVDGKRVKRIKDLDNKHIHEIYFERDSDSNRSRKDRERDRKNR